MLQMAHTEASALMWCFLCAGLPGWLEAWRCDHEAHAQGLQGVLCCPLRALSKPAKDKGRPTVETIKHEVHAGFPAGGSPSSASCYRHVR